MSSNIHPESGLPAVDDPNCGMIRTPFDEMHAHRMSLYEAIGFSEASAAVLAAVRDHKGVPLWPGTVAKAMKSGMTHDQALAIYG